MMNTERGLAAVLLTLAVTVGAQGCQRPEHSHPEASEPGAHSTEDDAHEHGHGHGEDAIGITRWTPKLELFAEHPPAIAGQPLTFLAHLTILDGFKALEDATVTLQLQGATTVEARVTEKLRPGIFQPTLKAPPAGTYQGRLVVSGPEVNDSIDGFEIVVHASVEAARQAASAAEQGGPEPITFLKEQQWQVPFATAFAAEGQVVPTIEVAGEVTTPPSGQAEVGAAIAGRVVAPGRGLPRPGQAVRRGELLATIAPAPAAPEAGARANLMVVEAQARAQAARAAVLRAERLITDRAISQREVDEAQRELRVAEESVQAAQQAREVFLGAASGRGGGIYRITAPIDGVVVDVQATQGKFVTSGERLLRIVNLSELWIRARVPEQDAANLRADQDAAFKLPGLDAWLPLDVTGEDASASVVHIARTVDPRSRTVEVIYALKQADTRLRVGAMVRIAVPAADPWQGVVVPHDAVLEDDGRSVVYVQVEGEAFEARPVQASLRSGPMVGIERGVGAGERVVTRGANIVRLSSRASSTPAHGHVH